MLKKLFNSKPVNLDLALLVVRVGIAFFMFFGHGLPKLGRLGDDQVQFIDFMGLGMMTSLILAIFAEAICSALIFIGLGTRVAVIPLIITMLVAVFVAHGGDPFARQELGLHYILVYVMLLFTGSGKYSVDNLLVRKKI